MRYTMLAIIFGLTACDTGGPVPNDAVFIEGSASAAPKAGGVSIASDMPQTISDEQNFNAVSARESIESDAERLAANRERYKVITPTELPQRDGTVPNIVEYALLTDNPVGVPLYERWGFNLETRTIRSCQLYASADRAQQAFLANGGPQKDRLILDTDGDGYACHWDPAPFRVVLN